MNGRILASLPTHQLISINYLIGEFGRRNYTPSVAPSSLLSGGLVQEALKGRCQEQAGGQLCSFSALLWAGGQVYLGDESMGPCSRRVNALQTLWSVTKVTLLAPSALFICTSAASNSWEKEQVLSLASQNFNNRQLFSFLHLELHIYSPCYKSTPILLTLKNYLLFNMGFLLFINLAIYVEMGVTISDRDC